MIRFLQRLLGKKKTEPEPRANGIHPVSEPKYGSAEYIYVEDDHEATIPYERVFGGGIYRVFYFSSLTHWLPPFAEEEITEEKREQIKQAFIEYLRRRGTTSGYEIV